jgi:choline kinase
VRAVPLTAVILAAGRGTRLGAAVPKCLLPVGGRPLLARYLDALSTRGIRLRLVTGHQADRVAAAVRELQPEGTAEMVVNADFHLGSVVSLDVGLRGIEGAALILDGDVFFDVRVLDALLDEPGDHALAVDFTHQFTGEEYMAGVDAHGRVRTLARRPVEEERRGEWVGFARLGPQALSELQRNLTAQIAEGRTAEGYEDALARMLPSFEFRCARVDGIPWVEIDFPEDIAEAERLAGPS